VQRLEVVENPKKKKKKKMSSASLSEVLAEAQQAEVEHHIAGPRVIVAGSMSVDYFTYCERLPLPGETLSGTRFFQDYGGKGANQAVAAARFQRFQRRRRGAAGDGLQERLSGDGTTSLVACAGSDVLGAAYITRLARKDDVDVSRLAVLPGMDTGTASITVATGTGENAIVIVAGANKELTSTRVRSVLSTGCTSAAHAASGELVPLLENLEPLVDNPNPQYGSVTVCQLEVPREATEAALFATRSAPNAVSVLNPAPAQLDQMSDNVLYQLVDVLIPNETEAAALSGVPLDVSAEEGGEELTALVSCATQAARALVKKGCKLVIVTLGRHGALACRGDSAPVLHVPSPEVRATDTSGAGDCWIGSFCAELARLGKSALDDDDSLMDIMAEACCAASISVTRPGTQQSYADANDLTSESHRALVASIRKAASSKTEV
jgi:ribokinase